MSLRPGRQAATVWVMSRPVTQIQQEIRDLTIAEKKEILCSLLEELDGPPEEGVDEAWAAEVERRFQEVESGAVQCIPAAEVFSRLDKILGK